MEQENEAVPADQMPDTPLATDGAELAPPPGDAVTLEPSGPVDRAANALADAAEIVTVGGPVVMILLAMSIVALAIVLAKAWQFARGRIADRRPVEAALGLARAGKTEAALEQARGGRGPASLALATALEGSLRGRPEEKNREAAWLAASDALESCRAWLRPLEVIAGLAPLLGLFGTVLGMIDAFAQLEAAGSRVDPSILSGGIWEALLTTAVGLAVAIPAVAALNWFERRIERAEHLAESALAAVFSADEPPVAVQREHRHDRRLAHAVSGA